MTMRIELDIFSGRPNPSWVLSRSEADELEIRLKNLPRGGRQKPRLGYRGFLVHRSDTYGRSQPWLRIGSGSVSVLTGAARCNYCDIAGIEEWFIDLAKREGFGGLIESTRGEGQQR